LFLQAYLARDRLDRSNNREPVTMLIPEPLSGAYNVMEFSIPNSSQFHSSQDTAIALQQSGEF